MQRVLVVGGAGYVGSVLTEELLQRGYAVRVLDRLYFGDSGLRAVRDRIELVEADMRAVSPRVLEGVDAVVNVGGLSNDPTAEYNPQANREMNTVATAALARLCKAEGVKRYVLASSCSIYDCGVLDEGADVLQDETAPVAPRAPYSVSKYEAEREILPMADEDFCPVALRKGTDLRLLAPDALRPRGQHLRPGRPRPPPAHAPPRRGDVAAARGRPGRRPGLHRPGRGG